MEPDAAGAAPSSALPPSPSANPPQQSSSPPSPPPPLPHQQQQQPLASSPSLSCQIASNSAVDYRHFAPHDGSSHDSSAAAASRPVHHQHRRQHSLPYRRDDPASAAPSSSRSSFSSLSRAASLNTIRKSRYAEPGTSDVHAELTSFSAHLPSTGTANTPRPLVDRTRCYSASSDTILDDEPILDEPSSIDNNSAAHRLRSVSSEQVSLYSALPEPALASPPSLSDIKARRPSAASSLSDYQARRLSATSSVFSLASARGILPPSPGPAPTSDPVLRTRSASVLMSSGKSPSSTPPDAGVSNVSVTTSSNPQGGQQTTSGTHALAPRDTHAQPLDLMRRNQRSETAPTSTTASSSTSRPQQPDRSRSRAKRRFSGSTANSSHSPGSDRGNVHHREEG